MFYDYFVDLQYWLYICVIGDVGYDFLCVWVVGCLESFDGCIDEVIFGYVNWVGVWCIVCDVFVYCVVQICCVELLFYYWYMCFVVVCMVELCVCGVWIYDIDFDYWIGFFVVVW